jgi:putative nucleotidyltransferase with HDIG domain
MMSTPKLTRLLFWTAEVLLLAGTVVAAALLSRPEEWHSLGLVVLLFALALGGERFSVDTNAGQLSASLGVMVLAMGLLGPAPAAACGIAAMIPSSVVRRLTPADWLASFVTNGVPAFAGGWVVRALAGNLAGVHSQHVTQSTIFGLIVLGAVIVLLLLNFALFALDRYVTKGHSLQRLVSELFLPLLPGELAVGVVATILMLAYQSVGPPILFASIPVLLIFRHLTVALVRSEDRAEQLQARSIQLVGLQLGVLRTLVRALNSREETIGQHAAAVASYAKALAVEAGCSEAEQEVIHTASLLHDIGKFAWPDRILHADVVKDEDLAIVKNHPQEGAILVGALDGYGEVADAILYHHERIDGSGYPAGLIAQEIPLASRILAICSTYDTMTTSHAYQSPMTPEEAMAELGHAAAHGQFDPELVETFITVLEREGATFGRETDYETELDFDRRVRDMAEPRSADPTTRPIHTGSPRQRISARRRGVSSGS